MARRLLLLLIAALLCACALGPRPPPAPPRHTSLGLTISSYTLSNGLRVVLVRDPHAAEVQITMRYRVGSVDDGATPGIAHMAEHLMYQQVLGTQSLFAQLEDMATYFNGETTFDATTYVERAPIARLDRLLSIEGVRLGLGCTSITDSVFTREREVVLNELQQRDDATQLMTAVHQAVYPEGHPYRQPIGGDVGTVGSLTRDQVCAFVQAHYGPSNAVLVVSGNITPDELQTSLRKFIGRVAQHGVAPPASVGPVTANGQRGEIAAPLDDDALLVTWPLPDDPKLRIQIRAIAAVLPAVISDEIGGQAMAIELGDVRAPIIGVIAFPAIDEGFGTFREGVEKGVNALPTIFVETRIQELDAMAFDRIQQSAIYRLYASLEDGGERDSRLANYALAGRDPNEALAAEFQGVREIDRDNGASLAREYLSLRRASEVTLKATRGKKRGHEVSVRPDIHDMGQRRTQPDIADAHRPATLEPPHLTGGVSRQLPNGLHVVLLPLSSVPTVDIRLVFQSGTADDPATKRGDALVAAHALGWDLLYLNDLMAFVAAGGTNDVRVSPDHTTFAVQGVDMHLDYLLAGLRRWVRDGTYDAAGGVVDALHRQAKKLADRDGALSEAWRTALYGPGHPYVFGGVPHADANITEEDVEAFRRAHYTPDNATLVITGRFDQALANGWVDYLFSDWSGHAEHRELPRTTFHAASIGMTDDLAQTQIRIAMPARGQGRARQLIAAEILAEIAGDVRHQLGATYGMSAQLVEAHLDTHYEVAGWVESSRAPAVLQMFSDRIAALHQDPDAAARAFVSARNRVLVHLGSLTGAAEQLGSRVEHDVALARPPLSDMQVAVEVRTMTIERMTEALADLDLTNAAVLVRGPAEDLQHAFDTLGRKPSLIHFDQVREDMIETGNAQAPRHHRDVDRFETSLTEQAPRTRLTTTLYAGILSATVGEPDDTVKLDCCLGVSVHGEIGYRVDTKVAIGLHVAAGYGPGTRQYKFFGNDPHYMSVMPMDVAAFLRATRSPVWGGLLLGVHVDRINEGVLTTDNAIHWDTGFGVGVEGGIDIFDLGAHHFGIAGAAQGSLISESSFGGFMLGVAYRQ